MEWREIMRERDTLRACLQLDYLVKDIPDVDLSSILHMAVYYSFSDFLPILLPHCYDLDVRDPDKNTALHFCMRAPHDVLDMVDMLVQKGADINAVNKRGETPLLYALQNLKLSDKVIEYLIENGADIHLKPKAGKTLLLLALEPRNIKVKSERLLKVLIDKGIDVNERMYKKSDTALIQAVKASDAEAVELLVEAGANTHETDALGRTAYDYTKLVYDQAMKKRILDALLN